MCGIAGLWAHPGRTDPAAVVARMRQALNHRGPDSHGLWRDDTHHLALGHARLAIVDLSEQGHQPMRSRSGRYVIVYNGEVYNHQALRRQLGADVAWRGHSDTETLLEAVERWGLEATLQRAVGMYALALWDRDASTLALARDRMGEKPLYYGSGRDGLAFASELKALHQVTGLDLSIDEGAIGEYLQYGYIGNPRSAFRGVAKLEPGAILVCRSPDRIEPPRRYWTLPRPTPPVAALAASAQRDARLARLEALLSESVQQQMLSDVPLGAFLSGGIDSSLVVAMMQRSSARAVRTFSMGFSNDRLDESAYAREVARHLGTDHTELTVTPADVLALVPHLSQVYDEPFADSSQVPTLLLSRLTREHVTVALSGDGGDELFGGYNRHVAATRLARPLEHWPTATRRVLAGAMTAVPAARWDALSVAARRFFTRHVPPGLGEKMHRLANVLSADDARGAYLATVSQWLTPSESPFTGGAVRRPLAPCDEAPLAQQMMWWDMQTYLPDDILVKVDRAAMACSLETRVPFLDHRIVEFALDTPLELKIRDGRSKWLLRELLARHVPRALFERPKQGFTLPIDEWLRGPLREWAEDLLSPRSLQASGLLEVESVRHTWQEHLGGRRNHQRALWTVLMLQAWLQALRGSSAPQPAAAPHAAMTC